MSDDLLGWLRDRLADDEGSVISGECRCGDGPRRPDCPDRIVAEVQAKRRIIAVCERAIKSQGIYGEDGQEQLAEDVLRLLSLPVDDRSGYRQEWRPT